MPVAARLRLRLCLFQLKCSAARGPSAIAALAGRPALDSRSALSERRGCASGARHAKAPPPACEVSAHLLRVTETADGLEWRDWAHPFLAAPFEVRDGTLIVPDRPGNGIEWDEAAVKRLLKA
jgi:hypothetical protein